MSKYKKILVPGGAGCIGIPVCEELTKRGAEVVLFDLYEQIARVEADIPDSVQIYYGSILDNSALRDALKGCDAIIHLAAYLGVRRTEINRLRCIEINISGTRNVLDCGVQNEIRKIVLASSSEVYGEPLKNPITEKDITQGKTVYAITKLAGEELCKAYAQRYPKLRYTILRYFNTYGPCQIAQFVMPKFIRNILEGEAPVIYGNGKQKRSYCYSTDTAWATVEALFNDKANGETINIGSNSWPISLNELAELVIKVCGKKGEIHPRFEKIFARTDREEEREIFERFCDITKARDILKYQPKVSLEEGIKKVYEHGVLYPKWATSDKVYTLDESI